MRNKLKFILAISLILNSLFLIPAAGYAAIDFGQGSGATSEPTTLSDKLPDSEEFIDDLVSGTKDAVRSPLGTRVISVLKDLAKLFVWALEQMLEIFKILINKL